MEPLTLAPKRRCSPLFHLQAGLAALPWERGLLPNALAAPGDCGVAGGPWRSVFSRRPATAPACPKGCCNGLASADQQAVGALATAGGGLLPQRSPRQLVKDNGQHIALQATAGMTERQWQVFEGQAYCGWSAAKALQLLQTNSDVSEKQ